jgi:hypothetical protein
MSKESSVPAVFFDGLDQITYANGVVRLHLSQSRGEVAEQVGVVLVPLSVIPALVQDLQNAHTQFSTEPGQVGAPFGGGFGAAAPSSPGADFLATIPKLT